MPQAKNGVPNESPYDAFIEQRRKQWDEAVEFRGWGGSYHRRLEEIYRFLIHPGQRVLELGCGRGDLLAALDPDHGVGVDFSGEMIRAARDRHPQLHFIQGNVDELELGESFDAIVLSDLINDLWDVQRVLERCRTFCHPRTRVILNSYSRLWQPVLVTARSLRLAVPLCPQNWITPEDLENLLYLAGFERLRRWNEILWPLYTPFLSRFANRYLVKLWPFRHGGLTNFFVARPSPKLEPPHPQPTVSVVVPARNEAGNIQNILQRTPEMGAGVEIIFVEGGSTDNTYETIENAVEDFSHRCIRLYQQEGQGKGDAVRLGFAKATGDILMILDADLTVVPEDLPLFYEALTLGRGDLVNGVRLVYPTEQQAMRFLNLVGNKLFSLAFSFLLGQNIKDTLCGTKVLWKKDYDRIAEFRSYFGDFDPFGDFDLLFGAAKMNLKIVDMPIRYGKRSYGDTNISRWKHGFLLLRMMCFAARRIKFI